MDLVATFCDLTCGLLAATASADHPDRPIIIADRHLPGRVLISVAAMEVAVHGWDIAQVCQHHQPIQPALATELLTIA